MSLDLTATDYGHHLLGEDLDLDAQLNAIRGFLRRNRAADLALGEEIDELGLKSGSFGSQRVEDLWLDRLHDSVYQDAAHSLAAAGMLAPLVETIFSRGFAAIGARPDWPMPKAHRVVRAGFSHPQFWNAQIYFPRSGPERTDIALGVRQLAEDTGLAADLPSDHAAVVEALFAYRNQVFHNGLEWPIARREAFDDLIVAKAWPAAWFSRATSDHKTWIIYLSDAFVDRMLAFVSELLAAFGRFAQARYEAFGYAAPDQVQNVPPDWLVEGSSQLNVNNSGE